MVTALAIGSRASNRCPQLNGSSIIDSSSGSSSVVERDLAKVDVAGSTPVSRSSSFGLFPQMDFFQSER